MDTLVPEACVCDLNYFAKNFIFHVRIRCSFILFTSVVELN